MMLLNSCIIQSVTVISWKIIFFRWTFACTFFFFAHPKNVFHENVAFLLVSLSLFLSMWLNYRFHWYSFNCILCTLFFLLEHVSMCLSIYLLSIPYESESRVLFCFQSLLLFFFCYDGTITFRNRATQFEATNLKCSAV